MAEYFITDPAAGNLAEMWDGHLERGGTEANAIRLFDNLFHSFQNLADFPGIGTTRDYLPEGSLAFPHDRYIIIYRTRPGGVDILHVLYGGRDLEAFFLEE